MISLIKVLYISFGAIYAFSGLVTLITLRKSDIKNVYTFVAFCFLSSFYSFNSFAALEDHDIFYFYLGPIFGFLTWPFYINLINSHFEIKPKISVLTKYVCSLIGGLYTLFLIYYVFTGKNLIFWPIELQSKNIFFKTIGFSIHSTVIDFTLLGCAIFCIMATSVSYLTILFSRRKKERLIYTGIFLSVAFAISDSIFASDASDVLLPIASFGFFLEVTRFYIVFQKKNLEQIKSLKSEIFNLATFAELGTYTAGIAHDIRNPLQIVMISAINLLKNSPDNRDAKRIQNNSNRIKEVIDTYIGLIQNKNQTSNNFNLLKLVKDSVSSCKNKINFTHIKVDIEIDPNLEIVQKSTPLFLTLSNLISNACDALSNSKDDKWIKIFAVQKNNRLILHVKDSGNGIPEDIIPRLFEREFSTKGSHGTGLGLYLAQRLVLEELNGKLKYELLDGNTSFKIDIPV